MKDPIVKLLPNESSLEFLPRLSAHLGGPKIYVKRDDEGGRSGGGNKLRKYERIIGEAIAKNCDTLIIAGHYQSNAARELVGAACQLGLKSVVVCKELIPQQNEIFLKNGNALLMNLMNAEIVSIKPEDDFMVAMKATAEIVSKKGNSPYIIPFGGSNLLGVLGYVDCVSEIKKQCATQLIPEPDYIFTPTGSGGTQAGVIAGVKKNDMKSKVIGISVIHKKEVAEKIVSDLALETKFMGAHFNKFDEVLVDDNFVGKGYGITTKESIETIKLLAKLEGIFLCPVYTAKAMTGLINYIKSGKIKKNDTVVLYILVVLL
jgi:1-aminocyclopropane-1-carboxylate deaminase/D-cysteine desulfhydrase-like pyridoxal-dependent ACC family enzyme